jgi:hypothetical protein
MRRILPRRSFVFAEVRWASYCGLRSGRSSIGTMPSDAPEFVLSPTAR